MIANTCVSACNMVIENGGKTEYRGSLVALQNPSGDTEERLWSNWAGVNDPTYNDPNVVDCREVQLDMLTKCNNLDNFIRGLPSQTATQQPASLRCKHPGVRENNHLGWTLTCA